MQLLPAVLEVCCQGCLGAVELFEGQLPLLQWGEGAAELGQLPFQLAELSDPIGQLLAPCLEPSF